MGRDPSRLWSQIIMTKYYLASWVGQKEFGQILFGNTFFVLKNQGVSLDKISEHIRQSNNSTFITILNLQELSKKDYMMLKGDDNE